MLFLFLAVMSSSRSDIVIVRLSVPKELFRCGSISRPASSVTHLLMIILLVDLKLTKPISRPRQFSGTTRANLKQIFGKPHTNLKQILGESLSNLRHILGKYWASLGQISDKSLANVTIIWGKSSVNLGQILGKTQANVSNISTISQSYHRHISGISQANLSRILLGKFWEYSPIASQKCDLICVQNQMWYYASSSTSYLL